MELLQLKYFCDAVETESFSTTARKFNVPPSDISQSVRRLETELDVKLFTRSANSISVNEKGRELYGYFSKALKIICDGQSAVTDDRSGGRINICVNANRRIVMTAVESFQKKFPDTMITTKLFGDPQSEDFDVIISEENERLNSYNRQKLLHEPIAVALLKDSKLSSAESLSDFSNEAFITMSEEGSLYSLSNSVCADFGFKPKIAVQSDDPYYIRRCVELGLGCAIVPEITWRGQFSDSILLKRIEGYYRDTYLYTSKDRYVSARTREFIQEILSKCESEGGNI